MSHLRLRNGRSCSGFEEKTRVCVAKCMEARAWQAQFSE
jgi:hypothetical protein